MDILETIQKISEEMGFDLVGITEVNPPAGGEKGREKRNMIDRWVKNEYYADMKWFSDTAEKRKDILKVMPGAKSVVCVTMNYYQQVANGKEQIANATGKIARYARGRDYHKIFDKKLKLFSQKLKEIFPEGEFKYYSDTGPVLERAWAAQAHQIFPAENLGGQAGLGFIGKNTNLITKYGSWVLLGEIITNTAISPPVGGQLAVSQLKAKSHQLTASNTCGSCRKCLDACPTGALIAPYMVDARKCISYLTIEHKGEIPMEFREKMGNRIFGCDACQEVCPFNIGRQKEAQNELTKKAIAGNMQDLKEILVIKTDEEFLKKFAGSPLMRTKRRGLVRNACIAAGNSGDKSLLLYLKECLKDKEPIIVSHAKWAIRNIEKSEK